MDFFIGHDGDIKVDSTGDIGVTDTVWRDEAQQVYIRCMTEVGDFRLYPTLGADLSRLIGMPQSKETGDYGKQLIISALEREGRFIGKGIDVKAVPISHQTIRFDIYITTNSVPRQVLSVQQELGVS